MVVRGIVAALVLGYAAGASGAVAQEAAVRQAISETLTSWESGDFETFASYYAADARGFFLDGGQRIDGGIDAATLQAGYEAGIRADFEVRDLDVQLVGGVALSTAYIDGSLTLPGGMVREGTWRYTETRVDRGGTWKVVQYHFSELAATGR